MTQFTNVAGIVTFAKSGAKLGQIAQAVLQNNRAEGLALLREETLKAALAAALWNNNAKIVSVLETVRGGKKTAICKQWIKATTEICRALPTNITGDASRITDENVFTEYVNTAIVAWEKSWADFEAAQKLKSEQRSAKADTNTNTDTTTTDTNTTTDTSTEIEALKAERDALRQERDDLLDRVAVLNISLKGAYEEIAALRAANTPPPRKRVKKETAQ